MKKTLANKLNGAVVIWIVSAVLAIGIAYGTVTTRLSVVEQAVERLSGEIDRLHIEINRLADLK